MRISARNQLAGTVTGVVEGAVNAEVTLDIGGAKITAMITRESVRSLGLAPGKKAYAIIKASEVLVAVD
ncbi:MAG TPA: TOBE domain-containing protein [Blastocatellia bacterium]|nr:TOBE domain-containing protein [Blastocatellia bacterium]